MNKFKTKHTKKKEVSDFVFFPTTIWFRNKMTIKLHASNELKWIKKNFCFFFWYFDENAWRPNEMFFFSSFFFLLALYNSFSTLNLTMCVCTISFHFQIFFSLHLTLCTWWPNKIFFSTIIQSQSTHFHIVITIQSKFMHNIFVFYHLFSIFRLVFALRLLNTHQIFFPTTTLLLLLLSLLAFFF